LSYRQMATAVVAVLVVFAVPAGASAATRVVSMGPPVADQKAFGKYGAEPNEFFPTGTTIHVGDSVRFVPLGFHVVNLPKKGGGANELFIPTGQKVAGAVDAAGAPFWFNGLDQLGFNPVLGVNGFGKKFTYTGKKAVNTGLPFAAKPKPMTVKFAKTGSFTYFCDVHPGMKGSVKVASKSKSVPSARAHNNKAKAQIARDLAVAKTLSKKTAPAGTVDLGEAGKYGVEIFAMVPASTTVPVGSALTFRMTPGSREVHTATFGPGNIEDANSFIGKLAASIRAPVPDPASLYPSDPPPAAAAFGPTTHGNGFGNSGALDVFSATPSPAASAVRFTTAGTYTYYCLIHPFMKGTVVVQ
jgi:plastocyanin